MLEFLKKNKKLWVPGFIAILIIVFMTFLSNFGFSPFGYVVF